MRGLSALVCALAAATTPETNAAAVDAARNRRQQEPRYFLVGAANYSPLVSHTHMQRYALFFFLVVVHGTLSAWARVTLAQVGGPHQTVKLVL
jgi:hypothetical protein